VLALAHGTVMVCVWAYGMQMNECVRMSGMTLQDLQ